MSQVVDFNLLYDNAMDYHALVTILQSLLGLAKRFNTFDAHFIIIILRLEGVCELINNSTDKEDRGS